jgi:hypothetical protein
MSWRITAATTDDWEYSSIKSSVCIIVHSFETEFAMYVFWFSLYPMV